MRHWDRRPFETRSLFNPAFCGLLLARAISGYEEIGPQGMPFSLSLLILPLCLHKYSRDVIAENSRGYLLKTVESNPQLLVDFAGRAHDLLPYSLEACGFLMERRCVAVSDDGRLRTLPGRVRKSVSGTHESISCQRVARVVGKEFARISDRATVFMTFGVRP
jgi:hypothetical protein